MDIGLQKMGLKSIIILQYRENVNRAREQVAGLFFPAEGWVRAVRTALGMSGAQLGRRLGVTRAAVSNAEKAELHGGITLKMMQQMAAAMGCRFIYAIVPESKIEDIIYQRALEKARLQVEVAGVHMALENQALQKAELEAEIKRLADEMVKQAGSELWNDT